MDNCKILILIIIVVFILLFLRRNTDFFGNFTRDSVYTDSPSWIEDSPFKYLNQEISMFSIDSNNYNTLHRTPKLTFESYDSCPNLYSLFHNIKVKDANGNLQRGEGTEGINFRNECEKVFYNASFFIRIEHPVIEIEGKQVTDDKQNFIFNASPNLELEYNLKQMEDQTHLPSFYPSNYKCGIEKEIKQINFGVKSDFTLEDIYRYVDYCYTQLCFGMIYIEFMKLTSNHYRVLPCPRRKGGFFILPERIRHQVQKEGKYYTRAKCNCCGLNIIVLFGEKFPEKFDYIYPNSPSDCEIDIESTIDNIFN